MAGTRGFPAEGDQGRDLSGIAGEGADERRGRDAALSVKCGQRGDGKSSPGWVTDGPDDGERQAICGCDASDGAAFQVGREGAGHGEGSTFGVAGDQDRVGGKKQAGRGAELGRQGKICGPVRAGGVGHGERDDERSGWKVRVQTARETEAEERAHSSSGQLGTGRSGASCITAANGHLAAQAAGEACLSYQSDDDPEGQNPNWTRWLLPFSRFR